MSGNSLSPWDISGLGMGFGLYRPRRPSYTFATQYSRQRSESYRHATRKEPDGEVHPQEDYIENVLSKVRKQSYIKATRNESERNHVELSCLTENHLPVVEEGAGNDALCESQNHINQKYAAQNCKGKGGSRQASMDTLDTSERLSTAAGTPSADEPTPSIISAGHSLPGMYSGHKNLVVLCISFILIFSPFRGVQNIQSSLNAESQLGIIAMSCVHGTMVLTCFLAPLWTNVFTAKWTLALGALCFLLWFGANFYPTFYTLIPAALVTGFGHGLLWTAETSYLVKLAFDSAHITRDPLEPKMFRFHAVFLACFQTTHIWGNLLSSLLLGHRTDVIQKQVMLQIALIEASNITMEEPLEPEPQCGVLYRCKADKYIDVFPWKYYDRTDMWPVLWKLMCGYMVLAVVGFGLIVLLLDRIGAQADPGSTGYQMLKQHVSQLAQHKTFRLLTPLMIFTGLQQGFMFSDYNLYFVTCSLGSEYIGFCMITLGAANICGAVFVALLSHKIPREVVLGFGGIVHIALMIGFLIWIPDKRPMLFFILAAAWGVCDAVWQTQCNTLLCLTCTELPEVAFANTRMMQSLGLAIAFLLGTMVCVAGKLYLLITLLVVSIMFYVLAEYRLRHDNDDVFDD